MNHPARYRGRYGSDIYITYLLDDLVIPWKLLTIEEYLSYEKQFNLGLIPTSVLEDEIFFKCVVDKAMVNRLDRYPAGVVSTIAQVIFIASGPQTIDELNTILDQSRGYSQHIIHQMVPVICQAFPAYKPEDVYSMTYETFMLRLAQAETRLLQQGIITEPIVFQSNQQQTVPEKPIEKRDLQAEWYAKQEVKAPEVKKVQPKSPPKSTSKQTIITAADVAEHELVYTGHEMEDKIILEHEMMKETAPVYKDYQDQMAKGEKVRIKTVEERLAEAEKRMAGTKASYDKAMAKKAKRNESLADLVAKADAAKKKK
jgi:hypothetical protein